jgi:hypothetical protein
MWLVLIVLGACASGPQATGERCTNGIDDDLDGLIDCVDTDCDGRCQVEICDDLRDNDGNGLVDCADPGCTSQCPEICTDEADNDGDGDVDCDDLDCDGACPERCDDIRDNDGDGFADCKDTDCDGQCLEVCDDGRDNDGDGATDCDDTECDGGCAEICDDGRDNDGDGDVDCTDIDCDGSCAEICDDERDNDGDALTDCDDDECALACTEACADGIDNDDDGLLDCEDDDCLTDGACFESLCADGYDDDSDGLIDCADEDCWGNGCAVTATATTGAASITRSVTEVVHIANSMCASPAVTTTWATSINIASPTGTVRTLGASSTAWASCNWNAGNIQRTSMGAVHISAMSVDAGCGLSPSNTAFLPQGLIGDMPDVYVLDAGAIDSMGALWFDGSSVSSPTINTSSYSLSMGGGGCFSWDRSVQQDSVVSSVGGGDEIYSTIP